MAQPDQKPHQSQTKIQLSDVSQTEEHSQVQIVNHSDSHTTQTGITTVQLSVILSLTITAATWICLLASLIVLAVNTFTVNGVYREVKYGLGNYYSYRYMMSAIVIGFAYTSIKIALEIYQLITGKSLSTGNGLPKIIFYCDKVLLCLLAAGVGAAFGATSDLKKYFDDIDDILEYLDEPILSQARPKVDNFLSIAYVAAGFLLIAFLCSIVTSILSSLALNKK